MSSWEWTWPVAKAPPGTTGPRVRVVEHVATNRQSMTAATDQTGLAPGVRFSGAQSKTLSAVAVLDVSCSAITLQPDFAPLAGVPALPQHQRDSKRDAAHWLKTVRPALLSCNDAVVNFNAQFVAMYDPLFQFAEELADPDKAKGAQTELVKGLMYLQDIINTQRRPVNEAKDLIEKLYASMTMHEAQLNGDHSEIVARYKGDKSRIADLKARIKACSDAMSKDLSIIGGGATGVVVGGLTTAVGVVLWVDTAGGSTALIWVGVGGVLGSGGVVTYGACDYNKKSAQKAKQTVLLSELSAEIAVANSLRDGVTALVGHLDDARTAVDKLDTAWGQLSRDYENVIAALKSTAGSAEKTALSWLVQANLKASKQQWATLQADAATVKANLLAPMVVDMTAFHEAEKANNPAAPLSPPTPQPVPLAQPSMLSAQNTDDTTWVEGTGKALVSLERDLKSLMQTQHAPPYVADANAAFEAKVTPAIASTNAFIEANEALSAQAGLLRDTAKLDDARRVPQAAKVLGATQKLIDVANVMGAQATKVVAALEGAVATVDKSLAKWHDAIRAREKLDKSRRDDAKKMRDDAQKKIEKAQKGWWCMLSPMAVAVATPRTKIHKAQKCMKTFTQEVQPLDASVKSLLSASADVAGLDAQARTLQRGVDGGLSALQTIEETVKGLQTSVQTDVPFLVKSKLKALAEGVSKARLQHSGTQLLAAVTAAPAATVAQTVTSVLQRVATSGMMVKLAAEECNAQPQLTAVENLLKQDQSLLRRHAVEWLRTHTHNVLSQLARVRGVQATISFIGEETVAFARKDEIANAVAGVDAIVEALSLLQDSLATDKLALRLFDQNVKNDSGAFDIVRTLADDIKEKTLPTLFAKDAAYSANITQACNDIVNRSTEVIVGHLAWGAVLGLSVALGQIEFGAAGKAEVMCLVKEGAKVAVKGASSTLDARGKAGLKKIEEEQGGGDISALIEGRAANVEALSELETDSAILQALLSNVQELSTSSADVLSALTDLGAAYSSEEGNFSVIKYALQGPTPEDGIRKLEAKLAEWADHSTAADLLARTYVTNFAA